MSMQDPIADMFVQIKNAQANHKTKIQLPFSKVKLSIAEVLKQEGYIKSYSKLVTESYPKLELILKYYNNKPVITSLKRVSRPGLRIYKPLSLLPKVIGGLGVVIVSTSKGVMSDKLARKIGHGGEILGEIF